MRRFHIFFELGAAEGSDVPAHSRRMPLGSTSLRPKESGEGTTQLKSRREEAYNPRIVIGRRPRLAHLWRAAQCLALPSLGSTACGYVGIAWNEPPLASVQSGGDSGVGGDLLGNGSGSQSAAGGSADAAFPGCASPGPAHDAFDTSASYADTASVGVWALDNENSSGYARWLGAIGNLAPGALQLEVVHPTGSGRQLLSAKTLGPSSSLSGKILVAHLYAESGTDATAVVFAQSGNFARANGEAVPLLIGRWVCVVLDIDHPASVETDFDPSDLTAIGVQVAREETSSLTDTISAYLDDFSY